MVHSKSETQTSTRIPGIFRPLLSLPVFYKVLFANSLIIFVGATGGTWLASNLGNSRQALATPTSLIIFVVVGWLVSIALNFVVQIGRASCRERVYMSVGVDVVE